MNRLSLLRLPLSLHRSHNTLSGPHAFAGQFLGAGCDLLARVNSTSRSKRRRMTRFEQLEAVLLLSGDTGAALAAGYATHMQAMDVSPFSVAFERTGDGGIQGKVTDNALFRLSGEMEFSGDEDDYVEVTHESDQQLAAGTLTLSFTADDIFGYHALFSKDAAGQAVGGHLTAFVVNGRVKVRLQSTSESVYLWSPMGSVQQGATHHLAVSFGPDGYWLFLDGRMVDWRTDFSQGLQQNTENWVFGANAWERSPAAPQHTSHHFVGQLRDVALYDAQLSRRQILRLSGQTELTPRVPGRTYGTDEGELLEGSDVHGGYGDDLLLGTDAADRLDGGHGEDRLLGGAGDDLLISRSDGREPRIAQEYGPDDDPQGLVNSRTRTLNPDQPIEADDVLVGGPGADTFRFEPLINAKEEFLLKHAKDDGRIHWHGVAGENRHVHDHWVDRLGNDIIEDFSRAEGDRIEIVGHTVDAFHLDHIDTDRNGILDATRIHLQSNQGNSGAHNRDLLGTITVYGDLVMRGDILVDAKPAYGIVESIYQLDEALTPRAGDPVSPSDPPPPAPPSMDGQLPPGAVFGLLEQVDFSGDDQDYLQTSLATNWNLPQGTISVDFQADDVFGAHALFSRDASGNAPGHLTAFVYDGRIKVRLQDGQREVWLRTSEGSVLPGDAHNLTVTFGADGFWLYLDGRMHDWDVEFTQGLDGNAEPLVLGANAWGRSAEHPDCVSNEFDGRMQQFVVYDQQLTRHQVAELVGYTYQPPTEPGRVYGTDADETLTGQDVHAGYGDDVVQGTDGNDRLDGGHGQDRLLGGDGDDLLISRADGREPQIAQEYGSEDDPHSEVDPQTRTLNPDQPIAANDRLVGGAGADTFRFEVLINAKERILLKHVMENRQIHWHGVAGENRLVHDHWVDRLGNDVIEDFNRAEGDRIEIVGHTVDVYDVQHVDSDNDGVLDASVIYLQSNQGNSGAHNRDRLGEIWVFGDLVLRSDYIVNAKPAYGIIETIDQLDEALAPRQGTPNGGSDAVPAPPAFDDGTAPADAVLAMLQPLPLQGTEGDHIEVAHQPALQLAEGSMSVEFTADNIWGRRALFSKDASGKANGGHLSVFVHDGRIEARLESDSRSETLWSPEGSILPQQQYQVTVTFGDRGFTLFVNGQPVDIAAEFQQGLEANTAALAIGASTWSRTESNPQRTGDQFDGLLTEFIVYRQQLTAAEVAALYAS